MRHLPPDPRFRALVSTAIALAACTPKAVPPLAAATAGASATCEDEAGLAAGTDLSPAEPVDALGLAYRVDEGVELEPLVGDVCSEGATCVESLLDGALRRDCGQIGCRESSLVWSRAGAPGAATDLPTLVAFLGTIDTPGEARLVAWANGYTPTSCPVEADASGTWTLTVSRRISDCPITVDRYDLTVAPGGEVTVAAHRPGEPTQICIGRLPAGLASVPPAGETVGGWLARAAYLEAASVHAFEHLHAELEFHGAPDALCEAALACRDDEIRHAILVGELARSFGAEALVPPRVPTPIRALYAIACDNAVEGCGREAWGAVVGRWQGLHAADPDVRAVMAAVARDELRHAEFSFALDAWIRSRLPGSRRARLDGTLRRARRRLAAASQRPVPPRLREALGLPSLDETRALWSGLAGSPTPTA